MNECRLLKAIVATWLMDTSEPVDADVAAYEILEWGSYGHEDMTRYLVGQGYLSWHDEAEAAKDDFYTMVRPTAREIFEAIS